MSMELGRKPKKIVRIIMFLGMLLFCGFSFFVPTNFAQASSLNVDYEAFDAALQAMVAENEEFEKEESFTISRDDFDCDGEEIYIKTQALESCAFIDTQDLKEEVQTASELRQLDERLTMRVEENSMVIEKQAQINRLIVKSDSVLKSCGASAVAEYREYHIYQYSNEKEAANAYDYYSSLDQVSSVEYDFVVEAESSVEADASSYYSWGWKASEDLLGANAYLNDMLASYYLSELNTVVVAVIDSGINTSHSLFTGRILHQYGKNFTDEASTTSYAYEDLNGHGTHVSGTIAEITLSNVSILPLKVLKSDGKGYVSSIVNAINYACTLRDSGLNVKAMNMSIGVDASSVGKALSKDGVSSTSVTLTNAVKKAYSQSGILSIVSAGNDAQDTIYANPANVDCAITVSALKKNDFFGTRMVFDANYSNYGSHVDFSAPGTAVQSAACASYIKNYGRDYCTLSGTSMAAPHVTAVVALIYSNPNYKNYSFEELNTMLQQNATDLGEEGRDDFYGYGAINIAKLGLVNNGSVTFSVKEQHHTAPISLTLSYTNQLEEGQSLKIFYSLDESVTSIEPEVSLTTSMFSASSPIVLSKTTKVTAAAFVYDSLGSLIKRSHASSMVYYFNNIDLLSSYDFATYSNGRAIVKYNGDLTTLNVPETVNYFNIVEIGEFAFNNSKVEVLYLPDTVQTIAASAFNGNINLKEIHCESSAVDVESTAFRWCTNLEVFDVQNVASVGAFAFANCTSLEVLQLPIVESVGKHAFSESGISQIMLGKHLESIENQTNLSMETVYGYVGTSAEAFASSNSIEFVDLSLRFLEDVSAREVVKESQDLSLRVRYFGYGTGYQIGFSGKQNQISGTIKRISDFEVAIDFTLSDLTANEGYEVQFYVVDFYGSTISGNRMAVDVVEDSRKQYSLNFDEGNYKVYVDGQEVSKGELLFENVKYSIKVEAAEGYELESLLIGGQSFSANSAVEVTVLEDLTLQIETAEQENLDVSFNFGAGGSVLVDDLSVVSCQVERGSDLTFKVVEEIGYSVKSIKIDGNEVEISEDGNYRLLNITTNIVVAVEFEQTFYTITISLGKGGTISPGELVSQVARGASKSFKISADEGYVLDYISVNGVIIEKDIGVRGNVFELNDINEDCSIYISLKKELQIFGSEYSVIVKYLFVFIGIFVVFIIVRVLLHYAKKEKNKIEKNKYRK